MLPLNDRVLACTRCPRLVAWREEVARTKVRRYRNEPYWGKPLVGFGDPEAKLLVVGLAPAAHGGNRTGRMFTGDASGQWLTAALYRAGFANQPTSEHRTDGLVLRGAYITAAVRCAPPQNRPTKEELQACRPYLLEEWNSLDPRVIVALGRIAFDAVREIAEQRGTPLKSAAFAHGARYDWMDSRPRTLLASYHPSRQNTQTGRLTEGMLDQIFTTAREILDIERSC
ncbi:MAG: uracil-DNA glycosylase [Firmicutes bacterium]|nr:uracil-DNA glycosylase [Bacillota bacterium]